MFKRILVTICAAAALTVFVPRAEALSITLVPDGPLTGGAGATIGWGYDIDNDTGSDVLWVLLGSQILSGAAYAIDDTSVYDFPVVGAGVNLVQPFDGTTGLVALHIFPSAPLGAMITGEVFGFFLNLETGEQIGDLIVLPFQAEVVPEPASLLLLGTGLAAVAIGIRRRRR